MNAKEGKGNWIGIDGCRGGWIIAWLKDDQHAEIFEVESLQPFLGKAPKKAVILIDMILYKDNEIAPRSFDQLAKSQLEKWHSRVFPAPPKEALKAENYFDACSVSFAYSGKKISKQCYNLFPKIREANHPSIPAKQLIEYHPEIAFKQLNQNTVIEASKKTELGRVLRKKTIANYLIDEPLKLHRINKKRKLWQPDDVLDALALAIVAKFGFYKAFYRSLSIIDSDKT
ncbi:DUF429 domain-containing protein [Opitutae bacterium]|nr:DUF429 domain-containing protein [Opitutae bacterium]